MKDYKDFPILGFDAEMKWKNSWTISKPAAVDKARDDMGRFKLRKHERHPMHILLNAKSSDLKKLPIGSGISLGEDRAYTVGLTAEVGGRLIAQLVIHEFDVHGNMITRTRVEVGRRSLYVAEPSATHLVVTIRLNGVGRVAVHRVEFLAVDGVNSADPGVYPVDEFEGAIEPQRVENFDELKDYWLHSELLHQRISNAVSSDLMPLFEKLRAENHRLLEEINYLRFDSQELKKSVQQIKSHLAKVSVQQAVANIEEVSVQIPITRPRESAGFTSSKGQE